MKQKTRFKNFGNIGYQYRLLAHEWPISISPKKAISVDLYTRYCWCFHTSLYVESFGISIAVQCTFLKTFEKQTWV